eukprot:5591356-Prymnesium_polylepis.1
MAHACGTLKSTRMRTRLPLTSTDDSCSLSNADFLGALATEIALTMSANCARARPAGVHARRGQRAV